MATEFIQSAIFNKAFVLTSEARFIEATTDEPRLSVSLTCSGVTFFSVELYAFDGRVELFDPGSLIEAFFIAHQMICGSVTICFGSASQDIMFLCCENEMPPSFDPEDVLLLSSNARRVHDDSQFTVAALPADSDTPFIIKAVGHDVNGQISSEQLSVVPQDFDDTLYTSLKVSDILQNVNSLEKVMYFSVEYAGRQLMCYITPASAYLTFRFHNIFNVPELIDIEGSMVTKSVTSRKDAVCSGDIIKYDRRTDRTYQFTTGPLTADEVESLAQLLSSHTLQIFADGIFYDVVIEEYSHEDSTDDDALTSIKFTWRFKGRRPVKFSSSLFGIQPSRRNIFSDQYSQEYE